MTHMDGASRRYGAKQALRLARFKNNNELSHDHACGMARDTIKKAKAALGTGDTAGIQDAILALHKLARNPGLNPSEQQMCNALATSLGKALAAPATGG